LLAAYAAGAATSLALPLLIGGRVLAAMKRSLGVGEWIRRDLGVAVLGGVAVIALGLDTSFLTRVSLASTAPLEQGLVDKFRPAIPQQLPTVSITGNPPKTLQGQAPAPAADPPVEGRLPSLSGGGRVAELAASDAARTQGQGRRRLPDLFMH
jgi:hypothetical protein